MQFSFLLKVRLTFNQIAVLLLTKSNEFRYFQSKYLRQYALFYGIFQIIQVIIPPQNEVLKGVYRSHLAVCPPVRLSVTLSYAILCRELLSHFSSKSVHTTQML